MALCPFRNFEKCPENNGEEGCQLWISYKANDETTAEGCANVLTPILLIQNINNMAVVANEVHKVCDNITARRFESIRDNEAIRVQMLTLASGTQQLVVPNFDPNANKNEGKTTEDASNTEEAPAAE